MKRSAGYLLLVCILALAVGSQAADLSASRIIDRYKKAVGGNAMQQGMQPLGVRRQDRHVVEAVS